MVSTFIFIKKLPERKIVTINTLILRCFVGEASPEQWRPCNEQYYPDFNRQPYPGQGQGPGPGHGPGSGPHDQYGPPRGNRPWNYG